MFSQKNKFVKTLLTALTLIAVLCFTLAFAACSGKTGKDPVIEYTIDTDTFVGYVTDADIAQGITVKVVNADGTKREVEFTVKSKTVSSDGTQITIVIEAEGVEKTIVAPYAEKAVRNELKPLYEALSNGGDKSFILNLSATKTVDGETNAVSARADVNLLEEEGVSFKIVSFGDEDEEQLLVAYKDLSLYICGKVIDFNEILGKFYELFGEYLPVADAADDTAPIASEDNEEESEGDLLFNAFISASNAFDVLDSMAGSPLLAYFGASLTKSEGLYTLEINTEALMQILPTYLDGVINEDKEEDEKIDVQGIFDLADKLLDGALTSGDYKLSATFGINGLEAALSLSVINNKNEDVYTVSASLSVSDQPAEIVIPEVIEEDEEPATEPEEQEATDLEFNAYLVLPEGTVNLGLNVVLHVSDFSDITGKDLVTATLNCMGIEEAITFVLNDNYVYLDISGLYGLIPADETEQTGDDQTDEEPVYVAFYQAFEIDGEPASIVDMLPVIISEIKDMNSDENEEIDDGSSDGQYGYTDNNDDTDDTDDQNEYPVFVVTFNEGKNGVFSIGATEDDVRAALDVYFVDEEGEETAVTDYTIRRLNLSESNKTEIEIISGDYSDVIEIVVYNPDSLAITGIEIDSRVADTAYVTVASVNTSVSELGILGLVSYSDGTIEWQTYEELEVVKVNDDVITEEFEFTLSGDYELTFEYDGETLDGVYAVHVFDPDNLVAVGISAEDALYVDADTTEEDLRNTLYVVVIYDDYDTTEAVEDYEIVNGYTYGDEFITVKYGDFEWIVNIEEYGDNPYYPDDEEEFTIEDLIKYLRFVEIDGEDDKIDYVAVIDASIDKIKKIVEDNAELIKSIVITDKGDYDVIITIKINSEDDIDLLAVINLFAGIPGEEDFTDINETAIKGLVLKLAKGMSAETIDAMIRNFVGADLETILSDLYAEIVIVNAEGEFGFEFVLASGEETVYLVTGLSLREIDKADQFICNDEMIEKALSFEDFQETMMGLFYKLMGGFMGGTENTELVG